MLQAVESRRVGHNLVTDQQQQWWVCQEQKAQEAQAGVKIAGKKFNKLRYAYDTTLMAESEEELKSLL